MIYINYLLLFIYLFIYFCHYGYCHYIWFSHHYNIIYHCSYCINVLLYLIVNMCIPPKCQNKMTANISLLVTQYMCNYHNNTNNIVIIMISRRWCTGEPNSFMYLLQRLTTLSVAIWVGNSTSVHGFSRA